MELDPEGPHLLQLLLEVLLGAVQDERALENFVLGAFEVFHLPDDLPLQLPEVCLTEVFQGGAGRSCKVAVALQQSVGDLLDAVARFFYSCHLGRENYFFCLLRDTEVDFYLFCFLAAQQIVKTLYFDFNPILQLPRSKGRKNFERHIINFLVNLVAKGNALAKGRVKLNPLRLGRTRKLCIRQLIEYKNLFQVYCTCIIFRMNIRKLKPLGSKQVLKMRG